MYNDKTENSPFLIMSVGISFGLGCQIGRSSSFYLLQLVGFAVLLPEHPFHLQTLCQIDFVPQQKPHFAVLLVEYLSQLANGLVVLPYYHLHAA